MKQLIAAICALAVAGASANPFGDPVPRSTGAQSASQRAAVAVAEDGQLRLVAELTVDEQLAEWAKRSGWTFRWYPDFSWRVIAPSHYGKDFEKAFVEVMDILMHEEGKPLRFSVSRGNRVVEVFANELR